MPASPRQPLTKVFGWLVYGLLLGAGLGFALLDLRAARAGYYWYSRYYVDDVVAYPLGGAFIGIVIGAVVDLMSRASTWGNAALRRVWCLLPFLLLWYELLRPAFQCARE
jgi:hypothetical protein